MPLVYMAVSNRLKWIIEVRWVKVKDNWDKLALFVSQTSRREWGVKDEEIFLLYNIQTSKSVVNWQPLWLNIMIDSENVYLLKVAKFHIC